MQNNFAVSDDHVISRKCVVMMFVAFLLTLTVQTADATVDKKPSHSKFSKNSKIKTINDLRIIVDISGSMK